MLYPALTKLSQAYIVWPWNCVSNPEIVIFFLPRRLHSPVRLFLSGLALGAKLDKKIPDYLAKKLSCVYHRNDNNINDNEDFILSVIYLPSLSINVNIHLYNVFLYILHMLGNTFLCLLLCIHNISFSVVKGASS